MKKIYTLTFLLISCTACIKATAQTTTIDTTKKLKVLQPVRRSYIATGMDAAIFSAAAVDNSIGSKSKLRFSYILNWGFTFNLNLSRHIGVYTGLDIKNIGFVEEVSGITIKRRTYNVGAPVGIKVGNMVDKKCYGFVGGGIDVPINYKEKSFATRSHKTKFNEWFSDRTPQVMPYMFAGFAFNKGLTLKVQYYPNNFLNPDFTANGSKPYAGYKVTMQSLSLAVCVPVKRKNEHVRMIGDKG